MKRCSKCGYINVDQAEQCAACGQTLTAAAVGAPVAGGRPTTVIRTGAMQQPVPRPTRVGIADADEPVAPRHAFTLTLMAEEGENLAPVTNTYEGDSVVLNRDNTQPGNRTITSRQQAVVTHRDGKWVIENRSDYESTFIRVTRPIELVPGDVVAMGDRRFRFDIVEQTETLSK